MSFLSVGLGNALNLVLLLDGVRVLVLGGGVDDLVGEALSNGLEVTERGVTSTLGHEVNSLVDAAERRNINSLATDNTSGTNAGGVFTGASTSDGIGKNLEGVLLGLESNDLKSVLDDADSKAVKYAERKTWSWFSNRDVHKKGERVPGRS